MKSSRNRWIRGVGAVVVVGGLLITGWGLGVTSAAPPASNPGNPFQAISDKLDQVLAAIGGFQEGNHTLRWDSNNPSATRFTTVFTGAVLDNNTGLVWEQAPDITGGPNSDGRRSWANATSYCVSKTVGDTVGWRLPSVVELKSVQDPTLSVPFVPLVATGGVFTNLQSLYWSASTDAGNPTFAWIVSFGSPAVNPTNKSNLIAVWCVRGPMNADTY